MSPRPGFNDDKLSSPLLRLPGDAAPLCSNLDLWQRCSTEMFKLLSKQDMERSARLTGLEPPPSFALGQCDLLRELLADQRTGTTVDADRWSSPTSSQTREGFPGLDLHRKTHKNAVRGYFQQDFVPWLFHSTGTMTRVVMVKVTWGKNQLLSGASPLCLSYFMTHVIQLTDILCDHDHINI